MKKVNERLFSSLMAERLTDKTMNMVSGGVTTNDCTGSGSATDCGDDGSKGDGYNGDNVVTRKEYDSCREH